MNDTELIIHKIKTLEASLLANDPQMPTLLRDIHSTLKKDPALVTLLEPEQVAIIVKGLQKQTNATLAGTATKPTAAAKLKLKNVTAEDLGL